MILAVFIYPALGRPGSSGGACDEDDDGDVTAEELELLDDEIDGGARERLRREAYVSMCGPLGCCPVCGRVVRPSSPKDVPVTIYMSCMMVWCAWNLSRRAQTRGIVHEDEGNL